jgi:hypothetical protein
MTKETRIRAKEARTKYLENYIEFENIIRMLSRSKIDLYKTKNKSLREMIHDLSKVNEYKKMDLPIRTIKLNNKIRNWLVHSSRNKIVSEKYLNNMKNMEEFNKKLVSYL